MSDKDKKDPRVPFFAGAVAGIIADAITHPVSTAKARLYTQNIQQGTFSLMKQIALKEGWSKLFTGFSVTIGSAPARALYFGGYEGAKAQLTTISPDPQHPLVHFLAGCFAQFSGSLLWVPMDVTKERMQVQTGNVYRNPFHCGYVMMQKEGVSSIYRGFLLHQFLWGPFNAIFWPMYEKSKSIFVEEEETNSVYKYALCSFASAAIAGAVTNPVDLIKVRLQTSTDSKGAVESFKALLSQGGVRNLYKGTSARVLWIAPNMTLVLSIYESLSKHLGC